MPDATQHAERVLAAIIPGRRDLLETAVQKLPYEVFVDSLLLNMFKLVERYGDVTGGILTREALEEMIAGSVDPARVVLYLETYDKLHDASVEDTDFAWSIEQLKELTADRATKEVLADTMEIVAKGKEVSKGVTLMGHDDARSYALEQFSLIDRELTFEEAPEGDMRKERVDILADYAARKNSRLTGTNEGIKFGILEVDHVFGGFQPGEFGIVGAYTSDGKTTLCVQLAWHAAVKQGKNVVFFSTETVQSVVRRKIVARHSLEPQFNLPEGLNTKDLKEGTLSDVEEVRLQEILLDLEQNPAYGKIYIVQVPREASIVTLEHRIARLQRQFDIDLVVVDYLAQFRAGEKIDSYRERMTSVLKDAKRLAVTSRNGRGIVLVSPWQINRDWYEKGNQLGAYSKSAFAETSEAERSPDLLFTLLGQADNTDRVREVKFQVLKNRDGETNNSLRVEVDFATGRFSSKGAGSLSSAMSRTRSEEDVLGSFN